MRFDFIPLAGEAAPRPWAGDLAEPASVGVLVYPGVALAEIAEPFRRLSAQERFGASACSVALVGPSMRPVPLPSGRALGVDRALGGGARPFDLLVVPCGFAAAPAFETAGALGPLLDAVADAGRTLFIAAKAPLARRAHLLLRGASTMPSGAFWNASRTPAPGEPTHFIADGRLLWAIGPDAAAAGVARLASAVAPGLAA